MDAEGHMKIALYSSIWCMLAAAGMLLTVAKLVQVEPKASKLVNSSGGIADFPRGFEGFKLGIPNRESRRSCENSFI